MLSSFRIRIGKFNRRRPNGISRCENREQKPLKHPLPLARRGPHLIQQCLGPPHTSPQTAAPTVEALSHTDAVKSPSVTMVAVGYNGAPEIRPKSTPFRGPISKPHHLPHPWTRLTHDAKRHPDSIRRFSTMHWTDRQTDRSSTGKFDDYSQLRL